MAKHTDLSSNFSRLFHLFVIFLKNLAVFGHNALYCFRCTGKGLIRFLNTSHFLTVAIFITVSTAVFFYTPNTIKPHSANTAIASLPVSPQVAAISKPEPVYTQLSGTLKKGETLSSSFVRIGINDELRLAIIRNFKDHLDFRSLRPNDKYIITVDENGKLVRCLYESDPLTIYALERNADDSYRAEKVAVPLECRTVRIAGMIQSSLFGAFAPYAEEARLIYTFADIFASKIDFNTETRSGDTFDVVFEKYYKDGAFVGYGRILTARYESKESGLLEGFYFDSEKSIGSYFDADGNELGASFIRSPVPMARISSRFSYSRKHPILKVVRPHLGVDLAAPTGTPIMAASDGRVNFVGWKGGYGKHIVISHGSGYRTYYGHLSRFARGLKRGQRVKQKQIIGYVGSTGLSTGPHLDYRLSQNGKFKNPFGIKFKPRSVLAGQELAHFQAEKLQLAELRDSLGDSKVVLVKNITVTNGTQVSML